MTFVPLVIDVFVEHTDDGFPTLLIASYDETFGPFQKTARKRKISTRYILFGKVTGLSRAIFRSRSTIEKQTRRFLKIEKNTRSTMFLVSDSGVPRFARATTGKSPSMFQVLSNDHSTSYYVSRWSCPGQLPRFEPIPGTSP